MNNRYTFLVSTTANKVEIKKAVEAAYGVTVDKVRTQNYGPERKTRYTKTGLQRGKTNRTKKAIVDVAEGMRSIFIIIFNSVICQLEN